MALYPCGELQQGTFNQINAKGAGCGKWSEDLAGYSSDKYPEACVRIYHIHHTRYVVRGAAN